MDGRPSRGSEESATAATPWVGAALLRLLFAGVAGLAAFLYARQRRRGLGDVDGEDGLAAACAACAALGAVLVVVLQAELAPPAWPCPWRWPVVQDEGDGAGEGPARRLFHPGDTFESWMFECLPPPSLPRPSALDVNRRPSAGLQQAPEARPVLVRLEGRTLSLWSGGPAAATGSWTTAAPRVPRLALWGETEASLRRARAALTYRRRYRLQGAAVALRPDGLPRYKQWSRRHPICITATLEDAVFEAPEVVVEPVRNEEAAGKADADEVVEEEEDSVPAAASWPRAVASSVAVSASAHVAVVASSVALGQPPPDVQTIPQSARASPLTSPSRGSTASAATASTPAPPAVLNNGLDRGAAGTSIPARVSSPDESDLSDESLNLTDDAKDVEEVEERLLGRIMSEELIALTEDDDVETPVTVAIAGALGATPSTTASTLLLLARTARQKEEWFWRLRRAAGEDHPLEDKAVFEDYVTMLRYYLEEARETAEGLDGGGDSTAYSGLNALASRVLFSVCRSARWASLVRAHMQRRLAAVKLPAFMEHPVVTDFFCRPSAFNVDRVSPPRLDAQGLWLDLGVRYRGVTRMVLNTRLNLVQQPQPRSQNGAEEELQQTDEEALHLDAALATEATVAPPQQRGSWKIFRRLAESRFFQAALAALSNTDIDLTVELQALEGVLVLHVPPPPSDRLWLGFRGLPCLRLQVVPRVGSRTLRQALLCRLIERKLRSQLEKALVLPNMANVAVPFMGMAASNGAQG